jgi:hypothetical protein
MTRPTIVLLAACTLAAPLPCGLCAEGQPPGEVQVKTAAQGSDRAVFLLADGSRIAGRSPLESLAIVTEYGRLEVPIRDALRLRVARCAAPAVRQKVSALIAQLNSPDFRKREKASEELAGMGGLAIELLRKAVASSEAEIRTRAEKLVEEYERENPDDEDDIEAPLFSDEDELVTRRFTARGSLDVEKFLLATDYGQMEIPKAKVIFASFGLLQAVHKTVAVKGENTTRKMVSTGIRVSPGDRIKFKASGQIHFTDLDESCTPAGDAEWWGMEVAGFPGNALIGRVGGGPFFLIGEGTTFRARKSGTLFVCVAWQGAQDDSTGEYTVKINLDRGK